MWVLPWCRRRKIPWLKSRRLSKPFYRWAFRQGKLFTAESIDYFINKYARKYLRKRQKLGVDQHLLVEASTSTSINSDEGSVPSERSGHYLSGQELEDLASTALQALHSNQGVAAALEKRMPHVSASLRDAFARFAEGLYAATCKNIGLSHAKVREYWIYRGPKWVIITVGLLAGLLIVDETLGHPTAGERMSRLASATIAMTASCVMLYFKLPDSIRSSVARSAHDFYVETKHTELGRRKTHLKRMGSPKTKGRNGAVLVELAKRGDAKALAALLDRRGAAPALGGLLHAASEEGHEHVINVLLMAGVSAAEIDEDGQTALHIAVANGHVEAAERLSRADPCLEMGVLDKYLMTPLHLACEDGLPDMVAMLLSRGGDTLVVARSPQPSPETGGHGKGLVGFSTHVPPQPGPGGTLEQSQNGSSGGSLLFIAKRHSHDEAADLIRRASHGEKLPLPARLSQRSNAWSNDSELSRRESLRSNSGSRGGSTSSSPASSPASRGYAYSPGSLKSIASGVALEGLESLPGPVLMGDLMETRV